MQYFDQNIEFDHEGQTYCARFDAEINPTHDELNEDDEDQGSSGVCLYLHAVTLKGTTGRLYGTIYDIASDYCFKFIKGKEK